MNVTASVTQVSDTTATVYWVTVADPAAGFTITGELDSSGTVTLLSSPIGSVRTYAANIYGLPAGSKVEYVVTDVDTTDVAVAILTVVRTTVGYTYGVVNPLETDARYTSVDQVKQALNITDTAEDSEILIAIVATETAIDALNERSFPDTGVNPKIDGIPDAIQVWALDASIAVYKLRDTTAGFAGGSDDWIGQIDVGDQARQALRRNPLALSFKVAWGLS